MRLSDISRINWRFGCVTSTAGRTIRFTSVVLETSAAAYEIKRITPTFTGGMAAMYGQTCPPYMVKVMMAKM
jgi:hypothetical protein